MGIGMQASEIEIEHIILCYKYLLDILSGLRTSQSFYFVFSDTARCWRVCVAALARRCGCEKCACSFMCLFILRNISRKSMILVNSITLFVRFDNSVVAASASFRLTVPPPFSLLLFRYLIPLLQSSHSYDVSHFNASGAATITTTFTAQTEYIKVFKYISFYL